MAVTQDYIVSEETIWVASHTCPSPSIHMYPSKMPPNWVTSMDGGCICVSYGGDFCTNEEEPCSSSGDSVAPKSDRGGRLLEKSGIHTNVYYGYNSDLSSQSIPQHQHSDGNMPPNSYHNCSGSEVIDLHKEI